MRRLEHYRLAVVVSILTLLIPGMYIIGLPMGTWALIVLSRRKVRDAFLRQAGMPVPNPAVPPHLPERKGRAPQHRGVKGWLVFFCWILVGVIIGQFLAYLFTSVAARLSLATATFVIAALMIYFRRKRLNQTDPALNRVGGGRSKWWHVLILATPIGMIVGIGWFAMSISTHSATLSVGGKVVQQGRSAALWPISWKRSVALTFS